MESLQPQLADLTANIDDLTTALEPLMNKPLTASTSKQPLLDKAKTYILAVYALESLLFTSVRLSGTDAKTHPIFAELKRVKEYFGKITAAEEMGAGGGTVRSRVDKAAAGRFIKAGLSGNERFDGAKKRIVEQDGESVPVVKAEHLDVDEEEGGVEIAPTEKDGQHEGEDAITALEGSLAEPVSTGSAAPVSKNKKKKNKKKKA
ncbi:hypothetical protein PRZ48_013803 [Zasmidium cellare]|uniref:Exosome complex protein n=1 Tax=Zasmidium cellare TaxID=395010 RepID=A0ABR0E213_ZASCE|nr:hypothetical protein PRZ48_013803 [Zasmidium cellare]